jgi:hypothetical protein
MVLSPNATKLCEVSLAILFSASSDEIATAEAHGIQFASAYAVNRGMMMSSCHPGWRVIRIGTVAL